MPDRSDREANERTETIMRSWRTNAEAWTRAVRGRRIASRAAATDSAILDALAERRVKRLLDLGCGEGWLIRQVRESGMAAIGIDASEPLIEAARAADPAGDYRVLSYAEFVADPDAVGGPFDAAVLNFALLEEDAADLLAAAASVLSAGGVVLVQTLHPWTSSGGDYRDGWREERFAALAEGEIWEPMPWYFRTLDSWLAEIRAAGLAVEDLREPRAEDGDPPLSLLLVAGRTA